MKADVTFLIQRELMSCRNLCPVELCAGLEMAHQQEQWEILTVSSPTRSFAPRPLLPYFPQELGFLRRHYLSDF